MKTNPQLAVTVVLVCLMTLRLFADIFNVKCDPDTTIDDIGCSAEAYESGSGYEVEVNYGLDELAYLTIGEPYLQKVISGQYTTEFGYCESTLLGRLDDCVRCLEAAADYLRNECLFSARAYVAMVDCGIRYGAVDNV